MRVLIALLALLAGLAGCGKPRTNLDAGIAAFERKDYLAALGDIQPWAEYGDVRAQLHMGKLAGNACHLFGRNEQRCERESIDWYRKAAEKGNLEAQAFLGVWHLRGLGLREVRDLAEAEKWLLKAADQRDTRSMTFLGVLYAGRKRPGDPVTAYGLLSAAVSRGDQYAQGSAGDVAKHLDSDERADGEALASRLSAPGAIPSKVLKEHQEELARRGRS